MEQAIAMAEWIKSIKLEGSVYKYIRAVEVKLGNLTFYGASFTAVHHYKEGMDIVTRGEKTTDDTYEEERFELVGMRPTEFKRRRKFCFTFEGKEWYVSHYYEKNDRNEHHPFGASFGLHQWSAKGKIDDGEPHPYLRVEMHAKCVN